MAQRRLDTVTSQLANLGQDDVVVVSSVRTPIGKGVRGSFKDTHPLDLLTPCLEAVVKRVGVAPELVEDIVVGNVRMPGAGAGQWRMSSFLAGFPETTAIRGVNRQCSSGLQAVADVAAAIHAGWIQVGIGAGVESMSQATKLKDSMDPAIAVSESAMGNSQSTDCMLPMGTTSENVAKKYNIGRERQDEFAFQSYSKALAARDAGKFNDEIVPVTTTVVDKAGTKTSVTVTQDEGPRPTTKEGLAKLRPAFGGFSTAGNSSQVSDGAAAVLLMKRSTATKLGLKPLGRILSFATAGVPPAIMGIGPAYAIPPAVQKAGLKVSDIDVFEINEAFASQAIFSVEHLDIPFEKVNPNGGAIALGHPLGCTGARQVSTLLYELKRRGGRKYGVISMCIGTGMGAAMVLQGE